MTTAVLEKTTERIVDSAENMAEVLKDRAKKMMKQGGEMADQLYGNTTHQIRRHPAETVASTLAIGLGMGIFLGWLMFRKKR